MKLRRSDGLRVVRRIATGRDPGGQPIGLRGLVAIGALVVLGVILVPAGAAKPPASDVKKYDACLQYSNAPSCSSGADSQLPGGSTVELKLTITNQRSSNQTLGSVNLDVPAGSGIEIDDTVLPVPSQGAATATPTQLQLRNLNLVPGTSMTVTFSARTPCTGTDLEWPIASKQSNNFLGAGNDFSLINSTGLKTDIQACYGLRFVTQPTKTVVGATITDGDYSSGGSVKVGLFDNVTNQQLTSCPLPASTVTIGKDLAAGALSGTLTRALAGTPCAAAFDDLSIGGLDASALPKTYKLKASGVGPEVLSNSFDVIYGTNCIGQDPCYTAPFVTGNTSSSGQANGGNFTFVAFESLNLGYLPAGCAGFETVGADPLFIVEQRVGPTLGGELYVTYGIKKNLITKKYGNNSGQQFIPICAGAKRIELVDGKTQAVDCDDPYGGVSQTGSGWWGKQLQAADGKFTGNLSQAVCDAPSGFFFGILGSFQDYTSSDPCRIIDPSTSPTVVEWSSDTTYRYFKSRWPSSSATPPAKSGSPSCPDTTAAAAPFANVPWDGWKFG